MSLLNVLSIRCLYQSVKTYINFSLTSIRILCQVNDHKNTCDCFLWFIHQNVSRISLLYQILWSLVYPYPIIIHVTITRITFVLVSLIWWKSLSATLGVPSRLVRVTCWIASSLIKFIDASVVSELLSGVLGLSEEGLDTCWTLSSELFDDLDGMHKTFAWTELCLVYTAGGKAPDLSLVVSLLTVLCLITGR